MQTCYQLIWLAVERTPDRLAMVDDDGRRQLTYAELIAEIETVAAGLAERGITKGTRVATALPPLFDHGVLILALQRLGAVPALLNFRLTADYLAALMEEGEIEAAVIQPGKELEAAVSAKLPGMILKMSGDYEGCRGDAASLGALPELSPDDPAFIFYTSGTTGLPKGVVMAQKTTEHRIIWLSTQVGLRHGAHLRTLGFMPLSHAIGFYGVFLVTLAMNGTYFVQSAFNPVAANDMIATHDITYMFAVPQLYFALVSAPNYTPEKMRSIELALYGGAEIVPTVLDRMDAEWGGVVRHIYGTTETMCSLYNPDPMGRHTRLRPGFYSRTRIIALGGSPDDRVAPGEEGELIVDATIDAIFTEYLNRPDATAEKLKDGWYYTGDICLLHEDGDVDLIGRADDMIRSGGEHIHPSEVEPVLAAHAGVTEAAVIGITDAKWGEMVVACILAGKDRPDGLELDAHMQTSGLAGFKRPKAYVMFDHLPRNAAGKVLRRTLRDLAEAARDGKSELVFTKI
jgi:acyl-CoA synthetase (AMP-forming)/AMP-acid ligase II